MEASQSGFRTTPRACDAPTDKGHFLKCDAEGDLAVDINADQSDATYGHGEDIDPNHDVQVTVKFLSDDSYTKLTGYTIRLEQGDHSAEVTKSGDYMDKLTPFLA